MNSIEVVSTPEREAPQQAVDGPVLRVFTKENDSYKLQYESSNYQQAMKRAEDFYHKDGKDILVNEKDNPTHVRVKTNRHDDIDMGRGISSKEVAPGIPDTRTDTVLPSFYTKLPMDTKAFDERERADSPVTPQDIKRDVERIARLVEPAAIIEKQGGALAAKEPAKAVADPVGSEAPAGESTKAKAKAAPEASEVGTDAKVVLNKTGYELPEKLLAVYSVQDGKFHDKDTKALRFEDHGKKLSTPVEDRQVIAHMVDVAAAKNWGQLELKGTETFKQAAWLEAQSRGIETKGYKPNERDLEQLTQTKRERDISSDNPASISDKSATKNSINLLAERDRSPTPVVDTIKPSAPDAKKQARESSSTPAVANRSDVNQPSGPVVSPETSRATSSRIETGRIVEHGQAKYNFNPNEKENYFVKLATEKGEKLVWGKDLEEAMGKSGSKVGDLVSLEQKGQKHVTIEANKRDSQGKVIGSEEIAAHRNVWEIKQVAPRDMSANEKMNADVAMKVAEKAMSKLPKSVRAEVLSKMAIGFDKGTLQPPTPKVTERAVDKPHPAPAPAMDRSR